MEVLISEVNIKRYIVAYLSSGKREGKYKVPKSKIMAAILYKLKAGCQWRQLPTKEFFEGHLLSWQGVYYHFRKWARDGSLRKVWAEGTPQAAGPVLRATGRQPDHLQERRGVQRLPGQKGGQQLQ